jgi:hypothetical protein
MKKAILILLFPLCFHAYAQEQNDNSEVKKEGFPMYKLFTGGSATLGFSNGSTVLGITPQFGMSLTDWLDAGVTFNLNYISQRDYYSTDKIRQTTYGPGAFVRLFPVNFLFVSAQYEDNFIKEKFIPGNSALRTQKNNYQVNSLLLGAGYAGGRQRGGNTYYFLSVSWDILGAANSPYIDYSGRSTPQIRAGYNIGLFQKRYR